MQVGTRRAVVERLIQKAREESLIRSTRIDTVDPILRVGRRLYPFLSDTELHEAACTALRVIKTSGMNISYQTTLSAYP